MPVEISCRKHPKYKAERPPTAEPICQACYFLWHVVSRIRTREYEHAFKFGGESKKTETKKNG